MARTPWRLASPRAGCARCGDRCQAVTELAHERGVPLRSKNSEL
jgi:hypothetical protein